MKPNICLILLALLAAPAAQAQDYAFQGFATSEAMNQMHSAMRDNMIVAPSENDAAPADPTLSAYRPDPAVSQRVKQKLIADLVKADPAAGPKLGAELNRMDLMELIHKAMARNGLKAHDTTDALTAYWLMMWAVANAEKTPPTRTQVAGVRSQVARGFDPARAGLNTAEKQQTFAETLLYQGALLDIAMEEALTNKRDDRIRAFSDSAQTTMQAAGLNMRGLRLTDQGFASKN